MTNRLLGIRVYGTFFLLVILATALYAQTAPATESIDNQIKEDLLSGPCKNDQRFEGVKKIFLKKGAAEADIISAKNKDVQNIILTKKGKTSETVIVGAHYDKVSQGCGIIDNWSGIVILAHLYRALNKEETQKTYVFVAFDKEEIGLRGSEAMAKAIPKEKRSEYCAMVNLDSFGLGYPVILENASSSRMIKLAKDLGTELKVPVTGLSLEGIANADSASFKDRDIPAITLSALSDKWPRFLHSPNDTFENTIPSSVRVGYFFALAYLSRTDTSACGAFR